MIWLLFLYQVGTSNPVDVQPIGFNTEAMCQEYANQLPPEAKVYGKCKPSILPEAKKP